MTSELLTFFDRIRLDETPTAHSRNIVQHGHARFTILTERLIRMEWSLDQTFEDRATFAFPSRQAAELPFTTAREGDLFILKTSALSLCYRDDSDPFSAANLSIEHSLNGHRRTWTPGMENIGNLRGTSRTLDQCADAISLQKGPLSREGWALFDDSSSPVWTRDQKWVEARPESHLQDWYFFGYGHDYKAALRDYTQFGGAVPLVPRYVLGNWWSRFWAYHADDLKSLVRDFDAHGIPLDVLVVDMDWHKPDGWTGYSWNRDLFPDPENFLSWVHEQGLQATLNLHPADGIQKHETAYPRFSELLGRDPASGEGIPFAGADRTFMQYYFELLHHPLEEQGVDFWWIDWQQGNTTNIKNLDPLAWLNHLHFRDATRRGKRPMLYSRWGGLGNHRYPIGFSGDAYATWESLRFQPYFTATAANVAYGWWSHDIGGHFGATDPELYARWVQFGAVSPCLRLHSTKDPLAERRPWGFPEDIYAVSKAAMQFRYRLLPYLYSSARDASTRGLSLCTPMYYDYPECEDAYLARGQYFLGTQVIAAPVTSPADPQTHLASVDIWIPDGTWIEYTTYEQVTGPRWIRIQADLNRIPLFVRAGAILPTAPGLMRTRDLEQTPLVLEVFPGSSGSFDLYEDDGSTEAYQRSDYEITPIKLHKEDEQTLIHIGAAQGHCAVLPANRTLTLRLKGFAAPEQVMVNGVSANTVLLENGDTRIELGTVSRHDAQEIRFTAQTATLPLKQPMTFIHFLEYDTFEDTRQQLGTVIIAGPANPFDAELTWMLIHADGTLQKSTVLKQVTGRQIVHCPFTDEGQFKDARWQVSVTVSGGDTVLRETFQSRALYPGVHHWAVQVRNRDTQEAIQNYEAMPERATRFNVRQPFGAVLLENERERITHGEPLEARLSSTLYSPIEQTATLCVHGVGTHTAHLNGVTLAPVPSVEHTYLQPFFNSWMPETQTCYAVTLHAGENELVIGTQPDTASGWWGVGAVVFDAAGEVLILKGDI